MAFVTGKTSVLQTAIKAAVDVATAELAAGVETDVEARIEELKTKFFTEMAEQVDADNALFAANDTGTTKGGSRKSSGGGGSKPSGPLTLDDAQSMTLNFGAFKGLTLAQVYDLDAKAAGDYGYPKDAEGTKTGREYIAWLAQNTDPKAKFAADRAKVIVEAARAASDAA